MIETLLVNYEEAVAIILFGVGFTMLLFQRNLFKEAHRNEHHGHRGVPFPCVHGLYLGTEGAHHRGRCSGAQGPTSTRFPRALC